MTLVAFDFDGTLSDDEMIVRVGERAGAAEEIADVTRRAIEGELSYAQSLRRRASLLEGVTEPEMEAAFDQVTLRECAADLLETLSAAGVSTAILTGGFEAGVEDALEREGSSVDRIVANRLVVRDGVLTGEVEGPLIEGTKDQALADVAADLGVTLPETIAVGDGANDVPMLERAGIAVGFSPKSGVTEHCDAVVGSMADLEGVLEDWGVLPVPDSPDRANHGPGETET